MKKISDKNIDGRPLADFFSLPDKTDEQRVREALEKEYGKKLPKKKMHLGFLSHEFDLFSRDGSIVGEVKSGKCLTNNGDIKSYRFAELCLDCIYLMSIKAEKKIFVLTNKEMFDAFTKMSAGLAIKGIEIKLVELKNSQFEGMSRR